MVRRALFVCTGNIFRSLTAEAALRRLLSDREDVKFSSAGTDDYPHVVRPRVRAYLLEKGFDVSSHRRRTVTAALLEESHLVVAMGTDHQAFLRERFGREAPLFLEVCGEAVAGLPDIEEVVTDYQTNAAAVGAHVRETIDRIVELAPRMAHNIDALMKKYGAR